MHTDKKREAEGGRALVQLGGGAARVAEAQLGVQVLQLPLSRQHEAPHLRLGVRPLLSMDHIFNSKHYSDSMLNHMYCIDYVDLKVHKCLED